MWFLTLSLLCRVSLNNEVISLPCPEGSEMTRKASHLPHTSNQPYQTIYMRVKFHLVFSIYTKIKCSVINTLHNYSCIVVLY